MFKITNKVVATIFVAALGAQLQACGAGSGEHASERSPAAGDAEALPAQGSFELSLPPLSPDYGPASVASLKLTHQRHAAFNREASVPFVDGAHFAISDLAIGTYQVVVKVSGADIQLVGETTATIVAGKVAVADITLRDIGTGKLIVNATYGESESPSFACKEQPALPQLCQLGSFRCVYRPTKAQDDAGLSSLETPIASTFSATAECGDMFARANLLQQICDAGIPFSEKDAANIVCEQIAMPGTGGPDPVVTTVVTMPGTGGPDPVPPTTPSEAPL